MGLQESSETEVITAALSRTTEFDEAARELDQLQREGQITDVLLDMIARKFLSKIASRALETMSPAEERIIVSGEIGMN